MHILSNLISLKSHNISNNYPSKEICSLIITVPYTKKFSIYKNWAILIDPSSAQIFAQAINLIASLDLR